MAESLHSRQNIRDLPDILYSLGIEKVILCPGSRNAPLILSFAKYSKMECLSIVDERSAAYFALGIAQYSRKPVAIVCTSGTAVLNCAPALAEAYYQNIPLIIITADRPKEWIDQADGQTIRQHSVFVNFVKSSFEIPGDIQSSDALWFSNRTVSQAVFVSTTYPQGPVHINVPMQEPLYEALPKEVSFKYPITAIIPEISLRSDDKEYILDRWNTYSTKWIIIGLSNPDPKRNEMIQKLSLRSDTIVIAENISNISGERILCSPESFFASLSEEDKQFICPDLLITFGHSMVSKRLKQYLRKYKAQEHWHISLNTEIVDTFQSMGKIFVSETNSFLSLLLDTSEAQSISLDKVIKQKNYIDDLRTDFIAKSAFSDFVAMDLVLRAIPAYCIVHLSNSMSVRYSQLFPSKSDWNYFSNRGTSGIDGCTSTAMGSAFESKLPTVLITGDLAFLYDSNALWNNYIKNNFKIIIFNNKGGNIFRIIDTANEMKDIRPYFETPQNVNIQSLVKAYGFEYFLITWEDQCERVLGNFFHSEKPSVLEIVTNAEINTRVYRDYFKNISPQKRV